MKLPSPTLMAVGERNDIEGTSQLARRWTNEKPLGPVFSLAGPTPFKAAPYGFSAREE